MVKCDSENVKSLNPRPSVTFALDDSAPSPRSLSNLAHRDLMWYNASPSLRIIVAGSSLLCSRPCRRWARLMHHAHTSSMSQKNQISYCTLRLYVEIPTLW